MSKEIERLEKRVGRLEAENKELRSLWIENEGDIISLRSKLTRYFHAHWVKRLFSKETDFERDTK